VRVAVSVDMEGASQLRGVREIFALCRSTGREFAVEVDSWRETREPLATAMNAALAPFLP
jgi:hypothetical protein